jgi:uncharacterized membrane protein YgaE (UPF0421/DUF939 family)
MKLNRLALQVSIRAATAAGLAVAMAQVLRLEFPIYAMIGAVIVTDLSAARTRHLGGTRMMGTILGAVFGAAISPLGANHGIGAIVMGAGIFAAMFTSHLLRMKDSAKVAGYVCGVVLLTHSDHPWSYALYRGLETGLGIAAAFSVGLVPKLLRMEEERSDSAG